MIPNNLKIGDCFILQGRNVRVTGFDYEGRYIVEWVANATQTTDKITDKDVKTESVKTEEITSTNVNYEEMSLKELQELCKNKGLAIRGSKADVIKRLKG